jgi:hypothetical protein
MRRVDLVDLTGPSMSSADTHFSAADSRHAEADSETSFSRGRLGLEKFETSAARAPLTPPSAST